MPFTPACLSVVLLGCTAAGCSAAERGNPSAVRADPASMVPRVASLPLDPAAWPLAYTGATNHGAVDVYAPVSAGTILSRTEWWEARAFVAEHALDAVKTFQDLQDLANRELDYALVHVREWSSAHVFAEWSGRERDSGVERHGLVLVRAAHPWLVASEPEGLQTHVVVGYTCRDCTWNDMSSAEGQAICFELEFRRVALGECTASDLLIPGLTHLQAPLSDEEEAALQRLERRPS